MPNQSSANELDTDLQTLEKRSLIDIKLQSFDCVSKGGEKEIVEVTHTCILNRFTIG